MKDRRIHVREDESGAHYYATDRMPPSLPPVPVRDLANAWDAARDAAAAQHWGPPRFFRFAGTDDRPVEMALTDGDARCWASAIDATTGLDTTRGMSLLIRLLALIDLMSRAPALRPYFSIQKGEVSLHPALLHLAATEILTDTAGFDAPLFQSRLAALPSALASSL
ncbi:Hypothetical protein GbCGDNIH3_0922 [Granulibacter bethesdensis]|uniref:Uncharacterized protein n=1 Tax=Granulibacter bethesdensis TaxID=364410 RepID=A0AAN0RDG7_9PROT|nr:hypothetical protein [Granulibacter bethesdensis]AHJ62750.1 Hypothetical protein GbCGDNIH3_0922 [Granulibacter bethesdensis]